MPVIFEEDSFSANCNDYRSEQRDMAADMAAAPWLVAKVKASDVYAKALYAALCNMQWQQIDVLSILKNEFWGASWRAAGGIIADLRNEGDYMDWYYSGNEGHVVDEIHDDLARLGWRLWHGD